MDPAAAYASAKSGDWRAVQRLILGHEISNPEGPIGTAQPGARAAALFAKPTSLWTLLHQAAYWGDDCAVAVCLVAAQEGVEPSGAEARAPLLARARDGQLPADVAAARGFARLAARLRASTPGGDGAREFAGEPSFYANECTPARLAPGGAAAGAPSARAAAPTAVLYARTAILIPAGASFSLDEGRGCIHVGWHGSYDPPCGMDGFPL
jgi:hypothetical protein